MKARLILVFLALLSISVHAQKRTVSGTIIDRDTEEPIIGASVFIKGTNQGAISDLNGKFKLSASDKDILVISYIGYDSKQIKIAGKSNLKVSLESGMSQLDDVVVVGYGTQRRSDISTATASVNMNDARRAGSTQVLESLQGKVSGVNISSNDGSPAGGMTFKIRGTNSLTGGTQPLFVIDGVPQPISTDAQTQATSNPLAFLNMNDIESIEILKDASAAAIYGADGSNGVVLITTKKGQTGRAKFSVDVKYGINECPKPLVEMLSPKGYAEMQVYRAEHGVKTDLAKWQDILDTGKYNDRQYAHDWMDEITQSSFRQEVNASMSGGTDTQTYMLSLGYMNNDGLLNNSSFKRFTTRLNLSQKIGKKIKISANLYYANTVESNPITDWSQNGVFIKAMYTNPFLGYVSADDDESPDYLSLSPTVYVNERELERNNNELSGKLEFEYKVLKNLTFTTSYSLRKGINKGTSYWGANTWFGKSEQGRMEFNYDDNYNWTYEARLNYNKNFKKHSLGAMIAYEAKSMNETKYYSKTTNFSDVSLGIYGVSGGVVTFAPTYTYGDNSTLSYIARANYSYDNRYVFTASVRRDGSSKFGKDNKYAYFPAVSAAWRISEEKFMKKIGWISSLKARVSYGVTGNNQFPSYQSLSLLGTSKTAFDNNTVELAKFTGNIANDDLKWESSKQYNVGIDFSVLKSRLSLTVDYYHKKITDMLMQVNLPATSGFDTAWKNAGSMKNEGIEFAINAVILDGAFRWQSDFNISFNKNKVLSLDEGQHTRYFTRKFSNDVLLQVGQPLGLFYGYVKDGIYNTQEEIMNSPVDAAAKLGGTKFADINHDGVIDQNDRTIIGNTNPIHTGGWGNTFSYKGFELHAFLRWSYGNDEINANMYELNNMMGYGSRNVLKVSYENAWTADRPENNSIGFVYNDPGLSYMTSEAVEDGSFLRLSTLSLAYNFPRKMISKLGVSSLRVALTGTNLWLLTRYSGFDPEANTGWGTVAKLSPGYDQSPYPRPRSYMVSLNLGF